MPTNPNIALAVRPPQIDDVGEKIMTLRNLGAQQQAQQQQMQLQGQQMELNKLKLASEQREAAGVEAISSALKQAKGDYGAASELLMQGGFAAEAAAIQKAATETVTSRLNMRKLIESTQASAKEHLGELALNAKRDLKAGGNPRSTIMAHLAVAANDGLVDEKQARTMLAQLSAVPTEQIDGFLDQYLTPSIREREGKMAKETADTAKVTAEVAGTLPETPAQKSTRLIAEARNAEIARHNRATENATTEGALNLTPEGKALVAKQFAMTGLMPPMGGGNAGAKLRTEVINSAAAMYQGLDLASQKAAYEASKASLTGLQKQRDAIGAFEETALKNLNVFITAAKKVVDTGSPYLNRPLRSLDEKLLGSTEMAAFNTARRTVIPEFAKILANPGLSGQLSDSARKEVEDVVSGDATLPQILAAANVLMQDTSNRRTSYDDQIKAIQTRIATPPGTKPATEGRMRVKGPNGETGTVPNGTSLPAGWTKAE